jgi:glycosyltransferase A (GT-A) superfamily protein (DUF2064 family)
MQGWNAVFAAVGAVVVVAVVAFLALPHIVASQLERGLKPRPLADILAQAQRDNTAALLSLARPLILADIPADTLGAVVEKALTDAVPASGLELANGWRAKLDGGVSVAFLTGGIRARATIDVDNVGIGTATIQVSADAIPHLQGQNIVLDMAVTSASVDAVSLHGLRLPWPVPQTLTAAANDSLDAINGRLKPQVVNANIPPKLLGDAPESAVLVTPAAVAVLIGTRLAPPKPALVGSYNDDFIATARQIMPAYQPGAGVIAVAASENTLLDTSEALKASSIGINLTATEALLGIDRAADPAKIKPDLSQFLLATVSSAAFQDEMARILRDAVAKLSLNGVRLSIKPQDITTKVLEGAIEADAKGSATFANGTVTVDFALAAWGVVDPSDAGLRARYAVHSFQVQSLRAGWKDHDAAFSVQNSDALASLALNLVEGLPETTLKVPALNINFPQPNGDVQVRFQGQNAPLELGGRAVLLAPGRVTILAQPTFVNTPQNLHDILEAWKNLLPLVSSTTGGVAGTPPDLAGNYNRLKTLMAIPSASVFAANDPGSIGVGMSRAGLAHLVNSYWTSLKPGLFASLQRHEDIAEQQIQAIPGNASCGSGCAEVASCGQIGGCKIHVCSDAARLACLAACPGAFINPLCKPACNKIADVCHDNDDNDCINRVQTCTQGAATCTAKWTSGLAAACEAALATINATGFKGLAKVSGSGAIAASGQTLGEMQLAIASDLGSVGLQANATASAGIDASVKIVFVDFGHFLLCPNGTLSAHFNVAAPAQAVKIPAGISWKGGDGNPLVATLTPGEVVVVLTASEPPLTTLVKSNPGLLTCGPSQVVAGLALASAPHITGDLLAGALRKLVKGDSGEVIGAVIDGTYHLKIDIKPIDVALPELSFQLAGRQTTLRPRLSNEALIYTAK